LAALLSGSRAEEESEAPEDPSNDYSVSALGFGSSDSDSLNDFGVVTNSFEGNFTDELFSNQHPSLIYVLDSDELSKDSITKSIHN
jgi:hypothetical protein